MVTVESVVKSLNQLGERGIHALLVEKGIKGRRRVTLDCPIARYVHAETGVGVQVGGTFLLELVPGDRRKHDLSESVANFIMVFDDGRYEDLIA